MLKIDLHTHSLASGHALNSVYELAYAAAQLQMSHLGITEHGPSMKGAPHTEYFWISNQLESLYGVKLYLGVEANILNEEGLLDLPQETLAVQRIVSAGLHELTPFSSRGIGHNTDCLIAAMQNPHVKIIVHPYRPEFPICVEELVRASATTQTALELNNGIFEKYSSRPELVAAYSKMIELCISCGTPLIVGSDAHVATRIGCDNAVTAFIKQISVPADIVLNHSTSRVEAFLTHARLDHPACLDVPHFSDNA